MDFDGVASRFTCGYYVMCYKLQEARSSSPSDQSRTSEHTKFAPLVLVWRRAKSLSQVSNNNNNNNNNTNNFSRTFPVEDHADS